MSRLAEQVGHKIKELRKASGMTLDELGSLLNMKGHSVWRLETGRRTPGLELLEQLAEVFHVSPAYFLDDSAFSHTPTFNPATLDPVLRDLWEELNQRFQREHPISKEQATLILRAILDAVRAFDTKTLESSTLRHDAW